MSDLDPKSRHVPIRENVIFHVRKDELDSLEYGSASSIYLNLAIGLLPLGIGLAVTLKLATVSVDIAFYVFCMIAVTTILAGAILMLVWIRTARSSRNIIATIRARDTRKEGKPINASKGNAP